MNQLAGKTMQTVEILEAEPDITDAERKEIKRLKFVLDKANRFPNLLSSEETLKLSRKLADLERKAHKYKN